MAVAVKICGLTTRDAVDAAVDGGAGYVGFVFFPPSPRAVDADAAAALVAGVPAGVIRVGLFVDADDATLAATLARVDLDLIQAHGQEGPERISAIRRRFGLAVMKAVAVGSADDLAAARAFEGVADRLLFDARPPAGASRPGGNALAFDWSLLSGWRGTTPWLLAGGLTAGTLALAVATSGATAVDVSSGVESGPGIKSPALIRAFLDRARTL